MKIILYSDDMIEDDEDDEMPPETKKPKMDMVHKTFTWTEWDQKLEGDRVKGKSELEKFLLCMVMGTHFSVCYFVVSMNVPYPHIKEFLVNWLDPEDAGEIGLEDMRRARKNGERMSKVHGHLTTVCPTRNGQYQVEVLCSLYV